METETVILLYNIYLKIVTKTSHFPCICFFFLGIKKNWFKLYIENNSSEVS